MIPISIGELFDKVSILEIKMERITDPSKISNCKVEMEFSISHFPPITTKMSLFSINLKRCAEDRIADFIW